MEDYRFLITKRGRLERDERWGKADVNIRSISFSEAKVVFQDKAQEESVSPFWTVILKCHHQPLVGLLEDIALGKSYWSIKQWSV